MVIKRTVTSVFMVPTLKILKQNLNDNNFLDAYSKDVDKDIDYEDVVFLLFKPTDLNVFKAFLDNEYERTKDIIEDYDYEGGYVVVVYKLNKQFKADFELIKNSKYSETSKTFQKLFPETVKVNGKEQASLQFLIFNKDQKLIDFWEDIISTEYLSCFALEVWPYYNPEKETLNINKIKDEQNTKSIIGESRDNR